MEFEVGVAGVTEVHCEEWSGFRLRGAKLLVTSMNSSFSSLSSSKISSGRRKKKMKEETWRGSLWDRVVGENRKKEN